MRMSLLRLAAPFGLGVALVVMGTVELTFAANPCAGSGVGAVMTCTGNCNPGACVKKEGVGGGFAKAYYCGCADVPQWACCHLVQNKDNLVQYGVQGDCISCALPGACHRAGEGTSESPYVAACD